MFAGRSEDIRPPGKHEVLEEVSGDEDTEEGELSCAGSRRGSCKEKPPSQLLRLSSCLGSQTPSGASMGMKENRKEQLSTPIRSPGLLAKHSPNYLCSFHLGEAISPLL